MIKYTAFLLAPLALSACIKVNSPAETSEKGAPPNIWSHHKVLDVSLDTCVAKAKLVLESVGYDHVVQANDSAYGNLASNRAAVKCVAQTGGSFVYMTVAGPVSKTVEEQRNALAARF